MLRFIFVFFTISALFAPAPFAQTYAQEEKNSINIKTNPKLSELNKQYEDAVKNLSQEQREHLEHLKSENIRLREPLSAILVQEKNLSACTALQPGFLQTHKDMWRIYRLAKLEELDAGYKQISALKAGIDFIERDLLNGHLKFQENLQNQLMSGMAEIAAKLILENKDIEKCDQLKAELESYKDAVRIEAAQRKGLVNTQTDGAEGAPKMCGAHFFYQMPSGPQISAALVFVKTDNNEVTFDYSNKIFMPDKTNLKIDHSWFDIGTLNTRFRAKSTRPGQELIINKIPTQDIVKTLYYLKDRPIVFGIKASEWEKDVIFEARIQDDKELQKFVDCAATLEPRLQESFKKAGFEVPDNIATYAAQERTQTHRTYYTQSLVNDNNVPGMCAWVFNSNDEGAEIQLGGSLIATGFLKDTHSMNMTTALWAIGFHNSESGQKRLNIKNAKFTMTDPKTGKTISSEDFAKDVIKGERHETIMPFDAYLPLITAIYSSGLTVSVDAEGFDRPIQQNYSAPAKEDYKDFYNCMISLIKDVKSREKAAKN